MLLVLLQNNMDLLFLCGLILTLITIYVFHILLTYKTKNGEAQSTPPLPPGNVGFPFLGESFEFWLHLRAGQLENFVLKRMSRYSHHVFKTSLMATPMAVLCGSAGMKFLFTNEDKVVKHWWPSAPSTLLAPCREEPFSTKSIILTFFKLDDLKKKVGIMDKLAQRQLGTKWQGRQQVMVFPLAKDYAFTTACYLALSIEDVELIQKLQAQLTTIMVGMKMLKINLPGTAYYRALKAWNVTRKHLAEIVGQRRAKLLATYEEKVSTSDQFRDTLTNLLVAMSESGQRISDMEIADRLIGVLLVIQDSTSITITMIFKYLAMHPDIYDAVLRENIEVAAHKTSGEALDWEDIQKMQYSWNVAREVLRLCPPGFALFREAITDFTYAGYHIPKGWKFLLCLKAIHMDPKYFADPEKFDPSRFEGDGPLPNTYMPFGGGHSICPGRNYAQALMLTFIHQAVRRFKWELMLNSKEKMLVKPLPRPANGLPIRLYPHPDQTYV